jgi:archaellum component FlaC
MMATHEVSDAQRRQMIEDAAYFLAEHRGFNGGNAVADWLQAEAEMDGRLGETRRLFDRLEERLAAVDRKLKAARKKVTGMKAEAREEWEQDVQKLEKLRDDLHKKFVHLRKQGLHAGEKTRQEVERAWDEVSDVLHRLDRGVKKVRK